jgi:hypothetical protein
MSIVMVDKSDKNFESGMPPEPKLMAAIGKMAEELFKSGVMLETGGLRPTSTGARVRAAGGKVTVKDGPFTEAKELIGGYAIMQVRSKEEAVELGKKFMQAHIDALGASFVGELEVRQLADPDCAPPGNRP